jgi:hypothetical protein
MTPNTRRKLQQLANQLNVQVEEIEKPPFEINDNTDDVMEPRPAALPPPSNKVLNASTVRSSKNRDLMVNQEGDDQQMNGMVLH